MLTVLIAEDSDIDYLRVSRFIEPLGHEVFRASDGIEAINHLDDLVYDLVLLDVDMPGADGFEVLKQIQDRPHLKEMPVAMLTSRSSASDKLVSSKLGALDHLIKPAKREQILRLLSEIENAK